MRWSNPLPVVFSVFLIFLASCTASLRTAPTPGKPSVPFLWQSKDFTVLVVNSPATSEELAGTYLNDTGLAWRIEDFNGTDRFAAGSEVIIPLTERNAPGVTPKSIQLVPILCYHRFGSGIKNKLILPEKDFKKQMAYLKENNYRVIRLSDLEDFLYGKKSIPKRSVVITVDDGYKSFYDIAFPVLKKYGFPVTLFTYTDYIGAGPGALIWEELKELEQSGLVDIQSHSKTHANLANIQKEGKASVMTELLVPVDLINRKLEHPVSYLAYPFGKTDDALIVLAREAGLRLGLTVDRGGNAFYENPFTLKRSMIFSGEEFSHFLKNLTVDERFNN